MENKLIKLLDEIDILIKKYDDEYNESEYHERRNFLDGKLSGLKEAKAKIISTLS